MSFNDANFSGNRWANGRNFGNSGNVGFTGQQQVYETYGKKYSGLTGQNTAYDRSYKDNNYNNYHTIDPSYWNRPQGGKMRKSRKMRRSRKMRKSRKMRRSRNMRK